MSNLFDGLNLAELQEECNRLEKGNNTNFLDNFVQFPKQGHFSVRLLPPAPGKKFYCATRIHKLEFSDGKFKNIHCTRVLKTINGVARWVDENSKDPCPICKKYQDLWSLADKAKREGDKKANESYIEQARKLKPLEKYYYNCIVRSQLNQKTEVLEKNVGPKILPVGKILHQKILRAIMGDKANDEPPLGDITDPKNGRDFKIIKRLKEGVDQFPSYDDSKFLDPSPLGDRDQMNKWFENFHDLAALRRLITHKEMEIELGKFLGLIPLEDADEEEVLFETKQEVVVNTKKSPLVAQLEREMGGSGEDDEPLADEEWEKELLKIKD